MQLEMVTTFTSNATTGTLVAGEQTFFTIECPWINNLDGSCVPAGEYVLIPYLSPTHGATWCLHNPDLNIYGTSLVPPGGRNYCELHSANWARQLMGCIALGLKGLPMYDPATGVVESAVEESQDAIVELRQILTALSSGHTLNIARS
jgi:hypothetical protein